MHLFEQTGRTEFTWYMFIHSADEKMYLCDATLHGWYYVCIVVILPTVV